MTSPRSWAVFPGAMMIVKQRALVEKRSLGGIEIFRLCARLHRPPAEGDDPAGAVVDREHHPVAEPVVGHGDPLAVNKQPRLDHLIGADALAGERIAQRKALGRGEAERKALLHRGSEPAIREVAARFRPDRLVEIGLEDAGGRRQRVEEGSALCLLLGFRAALARHRHARHRGQPLDRVGEAQALGLDQKRENVAVLAGRKIMEEPLLVVDEEGGGFFRVEGREARPFAPLPAQFDALADDFGDRQPGPDLVQKGGGEFHSRQIGPPPGFGKPAFPLSPPFTWASYGGELRLCLRGQNHIIFLHNTARRHRLEAAAQALPRDRIWRLTL